MRDRNTADFVEKISEKKPVYNLDPVAVGNFDDEIRNVTVNSKLPKKYCIQVLLEANGLAAGKDHQFKGRYDAEKNAVIISLEKDEQSALSPQKCTT